MSPLQSQISDAVNGSNCSCYLELQRTHYVE